MVIPDDLKQPLQQLKEYDFHFENLVFEGGGVKMAGHVGVIQILEELDLRKQFTRFAGTSGGAIVAAMVSIGMKSEDMIKALEVDLKHKFVDASLGRLSFLPNIIRKYGWNPGDRLLSYLRKLIKEQTGCDKLTFRQVYQKYGSELCVVATNVSTMCVEYFHPKTTPEVEVALAIKCSAALPGYVQPVKLVFDGNLPQFFMDGCLTCNFPLHVFDGWYLSMAYENSFFHKLGKDEKQFSIRNAKTIGCVLMSTGEGDLLQSKLLLRNAKFKIERPKSKLAKSNEEKDRLFAEEQMRKQEVMDAGERFLNTLRSADVDNDTQISISEFEQAFKKLPDKDVQTLFGDGFTFDGAFKALDKEGDEQISMDDFFYFMQTKGIHFRSMIEGGNMMTFKSMGQFFGTAYNTLMNTTRMCYYKPSDLERTIGIDTGYIQTTDFELEQADKNYLVQQGMVACTIYLTTLMDKYESGSLSSDYQGIVLKKKDGGKSHDTIEKQNGESAKPEDVQLQ